MLMTQEDTVRALQLEDEQHELEMMKFIQKLVSGERDRHGESASAVGLEHWLKCCVVGRCRAHHQAAPGLGPEHRRLTAW